MESKPAKKFKGQRAWINWVRRFGPLPDGLHNRSEVEVLETPRPGDLKIRVKALDGRIYSVWHILVDAGTLYRTEGDPTWRHESARMVVERLRRELTELKRHARSGSIGAEVRERIVRLEWVISRNTSPKRLPFSVCGQHPFA